MIEIRRATYLTFISVSAAVQLLATYILYLTYSVCGRKVLVDRVWLTPFSAPLESTRSPEVNSHQPESRKKIIWTVAGASCHEVDRFPVGMRVRLRSPAQHP